MIVPVKGNCAIYYYFFKRNLIYITFVKKLYAKSASLDGRLLANDSLLANRIPSLQIPPIRNISKVRLLSQIQPLSAFVNEHLK